MLGNFSEYLSDVLRSVASGLHIPVLLILIVLIAISLVLAGSILVELFTEHRHLQVYLPKLVDQLKEEGCDVEQCISESGLLSRQKKALIEITHHPELTDPMREALAIRLLEEEKVRYQSIIKISEMVAKLGPMFGLLGTLIPLGPGILALGQGDTLTLSQSLLTAFDTTIAGLASAAVATVISTIRKTWYSNYMSILEALMDCVLEVCQNEKA